MGLLSGLGSFFGPVGSIVGGVLDSSMADDGGYAGRANYDAQKEFAQNGLQWKAADARAAGLHPLAAIGGSGAAFSPSFVAGQTPNFDIAGLFDDMDTMKAVGQNTDRAQRATISDYDREMQAATLRNQQLQNSLIEGQLAETWGVSWVSPPTLPAPVPNPVLVFKLTVRLNKALCSLNPRNLNQLVRVIKVLLPGHPRCSVTNRSAIPPRGRFSALKLANCLKAYGEVAKPFLAGAAHAKRWWETAQALPHKNGGITAPPPVRLNPAPSKSMEFGQFPAPASRRPWSKN